MTSEQREALDLLPVEDLIAAMKRRNLSFIFAMADHSALAGDDGGDDFRLESHGSLTLQETLRRFLNEWINSRIKEDLKVEYTDKD